MTNLQLPNITAATPQGQIQQMRSYLYQLIGDLQFALDSAEKNVAAVVNSSSYAVSNSDGNEEKQAQDAFNEIKSLIIKSADIVNSYYTQMLLKLNGEYFAESDFGTFVESTEATIFASDSLLKTTVSKVEELSGELDAVRESQTTIEQNTNSVKIQVDRLTESGATKVTTSKNFTFDDDGLKVSDSGNLLTTKVSENGMTVSYSDSEMLTANSDGVKAKNLHASTYLTVGDRSRFENYGTDRTGCFWIG